MGVPGAEVPGIPERRLIGRAASTHGVGSGDATGEGSGDERA
jgi:hypothetical protein